MDSATNVFSLDFKDLKETNPVSFPLFCPVSYVHMQKKATSNPDLNLTQHVALRVEPVRTSRDQSLYEQRHATGIEWISA